MLDRARSICLLRQSASPTIVRCVGPWRRLQSFVALSILLWVVGLVVQLRAPDPGYGASLRDDGTMLVTEVDADGPAARSGLRVGDVVVADPGPTPVRPFTERELFARVRAFHVALVARRFPLVVRRHGQGLALEIETDGAPSTGATLRQLRRIAPLFPPLLSFFAMAVVLSRRPRAPRPEPELVARRRVALAFAVMALAFGFNWVAGGWPPWLTVVSAVVTNTCPPISLALLAWFAWTYPREARFTRARWAPFLLVATFLPAATVSVLEDLGAVRFVLAGNQAQILADLMLLVLLIAGLVWQRRHARNEIERRQLDILLGAFGFTFLPAAVLVAHPYAGGSVIFLSLTIGSAVAIPIAFAVALARYRLFAVDAFVIRTFVYLLVAIISLLVYVLVAEGLVSLFPAARPELGRWAALAVAIGLAAPARAATDRALRRAFGRDPEAFLTSCFGLVSRIGTAGQQDDVLAIVRDALHVEHAELRSISAPHRRRAVMVVSLDDPAQVDGLTARGFELVVWLSPESDLALVLSRPPTLGALRDAERVAIENVGAAIFTWVRRHEAENELRSRVRDAEEARKRIAMELHDGIGATLAAAKVMTQLLRGGARDDAGPLSSLERTLSDGLVELRTTLASVESESDDWADTLARLRRHLGDVCGNAGITLDLRIESSEGAEPSAAARLGVLRIAQEALTNTVRHARARHVWCSIDATAERVRLAFEDDGVGLAPDRDPAAGRGLRNMVRRARDLGGSLALEPRDGGGLRIQAVVPTNPARPRRVA